MAYSTGTTLLTTVSARTDMSGAIRAAAVLFVAVLTAVAAQVSVPLPFTPVPFTLQPMVVLLGGAALGSRLGMASQVIYLLAGIAGLPVFAASAVLPQGFLRLLGPTGGYLMSLSVRRVRCRVARRARLRSPISHLGRRDGRRPGAHLRVRRHLVRLVRRSRAGRALEGAGARPVSVHRRRHPQDSPRRDRAADRLDVDRPLANLTVRRAKSFFR